MSDEWFYAGFHTKAKPCKGCGHTRPVGAFSRLCDDCSAAEGLRTADMEDLVQSVRDQAQTAAGMPEGAWSGVDMGADDFQAAMQREAKATLAKDAAERLAQRVAEERAKKERERQWTAEGERRRAEAKKVEDEARRRAEELRKAAEAFMHTGRDNFNQSFYDEMFGAGFGFSGGRQSGRNSWREEQARQQQEPPRAAPAQTNVAGLDMQMIRRLLQLCHPDKHSNSEASQKATHWLLDVKARLDNQR